MIGHFAQCDEEFGRQLAEGLGLDTAARLARQGTGSYDGGRRGFMAPAAVPHQALQPMQNRDGR
jgi:hypothetical protein